jgi:hypothetical protein
MIWMGRRTLNIRLPQLMDPGSDVHLAHAKRRSFRAALVSRFVSGSTGRAE